MRRRLILRGILLVAGLVWTVAGYVALLRQAVSIGQPAFGVVAFAAAVLIGRWAGNGMTPIPLFDGDPKSEPELSPSYTLATLATAIIIVGCLVFGFHLPRFVLAVFPATLALATFAWYDGPLRQPRRQVTP